MALLHFIMYIVLLLLVNFVLLTCVICDLHACLFSIYMLACFPITCLHEEKEEGSP